MDALEKLEILAEAARFDAACTSSGSGRGPRAGSLGATKAAGCCHTFTPDGRCITLLKVLMSNACSYDCAYCVNRSSASCRRATFAPRELAELTVDFYKRNYIEGLFLSSGVLGTPDATSERMVSCLRTLREELRFNGYVHSKVIPGTSPELVDELGRLSDRLSVNLELPSERSLGTLCPNKTKSQVMTPPWSRSSRPGPKRRSACSRTVAGGSEARQEERWAQAPPPRASRRRPRHPRPGRQTPSPAPRPPSRGVRAPLPC